MGWLRSKAFPSIPGHSRIDLPRPQIDYPGEAPDLAPPLLPEKRGGSQRAHPVVAVDHEGPGVPGFQQPWGGLLGDMREGDQLSPFDAAESVLVLLAAVDEPDGGRTGIVAQGSEF